MHFNHFYSFFSSCVTHIKWFLVIFLHFFLRKILKLKFWPRKKSTFRMSALLPNKCFSFHYALPLGQAKSCYWCACVCVLMYVSVCAFICVCECVSVFVCPPSILIIFTNNSYLHIIIFTHNSYSPKIHNHKSFTLTHSSYLPINHIHQ